MHLKRLPFSSQEELTRQQVLKLTNIMGNWGIIPYQNFEN